MALASAHSISTYSLLFNGTLPIMFYLKFPNNNKKAYNVSFKNNDIKVCHF